MPRDDKEFQQRLGRIDGLVHKLESGGDPASRAVAKELMQSIMDLHGAGLERMMEIASGTGDNRAGIADSFGADSLVGSLLVLYGLHPSDLTTRVRLALDRVRPVLRSSGATLELVNIDGDRVHLRIRADGQGCASSADSLKLAVEEAIYEAAPDVTSLIVESPEPRFASSGFVPLESLKTAS